MEKKMSMPKIEQERLSGADSNCSSSVMPFPQQENYGCSAGEAGG